MLSNDDSQDLFETSTGTGTGYLPSSGFEIAEQSSEDSPPIISRGTSDYEPPSRSQSQPGAQVIYYFFDIPF